MKILFRLALLIMLAPVAWFSLLLALDMRAQQHAAATPQQATAPHSVVYCSTKGPLPAEEIALYSGCIPPAPTPAPQQVHATVPHPVVRCNPADVLSVDEQALLTGCVPH